VYSASCQLQSNKRRLRAGYDCVEGTILFMESNFGKVLNIGSERPVSINQLANITIGISGKTFKKKHVLSAPQGVHGEKMQI
jgi:hypothetical protein